MTKNATVNAIENVIGTANVIEIGSAIVIVILSENESESGTETTNGW